MQFDQCRVSSSKPARLVHAGRLFRLALASVVDLVKVLPGGRLEGEPAIVSGAKLEEPPGNGHVAVVIDGEVRTGAFQLAIGEKLGHDDRGSCGSLRKLDFPLIGQAAAGPCPFLLRLSGLLPVAGAPASGRQESQDRQHGNPNQNDPLRPRGNAPAAGKLTGRCVTGLHESHLAAEKSGSRKFVEPLLLRIFEIG